MARQSSVTLLPASTRTSTTEFLRFHSPRVCDQKRPIICHKLFLQLDRAECVNIFRIVCYHSLGNRLADRIYLRGVSTALDAHTDVDIGEGIFASNEDGLVDFKSQNLRLNEVDGRPVDTKQAFALTRMRDGSRGLLFPERLYGFGGRRHFVESQLGLTRGRRWCVSFVVDVDEVRCGGRVRQ